MERRGQTVSARTAIRSRATEILPALAWLLALALACALAAPQARADDVPAVAGDDPLPTRVGRLASVQGSVYHAPDERASEWSEVALNYPVAQGDNLWVDGDGHAEVDYGAGQFRLGGDTNVHVSRLDDRQFALFIASGRVIVRVRVLEADDSVRVDTPATQVALARPGLYRIDVDPEHEQTTLIVREGEAQVATTTGSEQVLPGQTAIVSGTANVSADIRNGGGLDGFDAWSAARDRVYERPRENAYVSRQMVGQADLDAYGTWQAYPDYGAVWFPTVAVDWAPYRFGRWIWLPGWGYAWVDDAPWGYAPFHYGRWAYVGGRWGWCPGAFVTRPVWAPALVAWYGGSGWGFSHVHGSPVYGWVPLGWREPFVPWWRGCTARCYARYNRPYAVNVAERRTMPPTHFANWSVPGGITAVPGATLEAGRPVAINRVQVGTNAAFAPALVTQPPAVKPAPVRPIAVRADSRAPLPASTRVTRATNASAAPASRATLPLSPGPPLRADTRGTMPSPRAPDARNAGAPATIARPIQPIPAAPVERTLRTAPAPQAVPPPVEAPAVRAPIVPTAPRSVDVPAPRAPVVPAAPRVVPAPVPVPAPALVPQAVAPPQAPAPAAGERVPARTPPATPKVPDRPS
jgi:hypothetical protein